MTTMVPGKQYTFKGNKEKLVTCLSVTPSENYLCLSGVKEFVLEKAFLDLYEEYKSKKKGIYWTAIIEDVEGNIYSFGFNPSKNELLKEMSGYLYSTEKVIAIKKVDWKEGEGL